jgi:hypothetical protein
LPISEEHKKNGYLAKPYDLKDFSTGIIFCTKIKSNNLILARRNILDNFNKDKIFNNYNQIINKIFQQF